MLNYSSAKKAVLLSMNTGSVPLLVGLQGIGKTEMMKTIAKENDYSLYIIEGNLLKEGELGGLPTVVQTTEEDIERILNERGIRKYTEEDILATNKEYNKIKLLSESGLLNMENIDEFSERLVKIRTLAKKKAMEKNKEFEQEKIKLRESLPKVTTNYATFKTLSDISEEVASNPDRKILLFIDEINRADNATLQEMMNIILARTINGYKLPDNVRLVCAANPSTSFYEFKDSDFQVTEFDPAQLSRLTIITMEANEREWITWATQEDENGVSNIEDEVVEFIATQPEMLIIENKNETDDNFVNPRAWARVSRTYRFIKQANDFTEKDFYNKIVGDIGVTTATTFYTFLRERKNPLIKPEEIFKGEFTDSKKERIIKESFPRKLTIINNCLRYINRQFKDNKNVLEDKILNTFLELIGDEVCPKELMATAMSHLINNKNYAELNEVLMDNEDFLDLYMDAHKSIHG